MPSFTADQSGKKATFDFYNGFLAVIYGLLVSKGFETLVTYVKESNRKTVGFPLFLGTLLMSLHFWFVCATVDDLSEQFDEVFVGRKTRFFNLLVLVDLSVATFLALCVLAMFNSIPNKDPNQPPDQRFFVWFLLSGGLSLVYDAYSRALVWCAEQSRQQDTDDAIQNYRRKINSWLTQDCVFVFVSALMYYWRNVAVTSFILASLFAVFTFILLFLMDVGLFERSRGPAFSR
jgi:hypothetical protein